MKILRTRNKSNLILVKLCCYEIDVMSLLKNSIEIPEDRYCCKYCYFCSCSEDHHGGAYCYNDIGGYVNVDTDYCCEFDYDTDFERT